MTLALSKAKARSGQEVQGPRGRKPKSNVLGLRAYRFYFMLRFISGCWTLDLAVGQRLKATHISPQELRNNNRAIRLLKVFQNRDPGSTDR